MSDPYFEFPVNLTSRPGQDPSVAKCNGCTASSTMSPEIAMRTAAAKALNKSGMLAAGVVAKESDVVIIGTGRARVARYVIGVRKCRVCGCTDDACSQCIAKTGTACHWVEEDLCSACDERGTRSAERGKKGARVVSGEYGPNQLAGEYHGPRQEVEDDGRPKRKAVRA